MQCQFPCVCGENHTFDGDLAGNKFPCPNLGIDVDLPKRHRCKKAVNYRAGGHVVVEIAKLPPVPERGTDRARKSSYTEKRPLCRQL